MKKIILSLFVILLSACGVKETNSNVVTTTKAEPKAKVEFSNPALMSGSDFGSFFLAMLKTQNYDMAMKFVSKESLEKYGQVAILSSFKKYSYNYNLKLASVDESGSVLKFTTNEFATGKFKTINFVRENDTCKVVLSKKLEIFES